MAVAALGRYAGTLRARGRIYGVGVETPESSDGFTWVMPMLVTLEDWAHLEPRPGRAPRNDLDLTFTDQSGTTLHLRRGGHLSLVEMNSDWSWVLVSAAFSWQNITATPPPVEHRPVEVCAGCRKPWPCEGAA